MIVQDKFTYEQIESLGWQPMPSTFTPGESYGWALGTWRMYPHMIATNKGNEVVGVLIQRIERIFNTEGSVITVTLAYPDNIEDIQTLMRLLKIKKS